MKLYNVTIGMKLASRKYPNPINVWTYTARSEKEALARYAADQKLGTLWLATVIAVEEV